MRCERYWDEGILLVEQGRPDPHRDDCLDCRREHEARGEIVRAFQLVGAQDADPAWKRRVWEQIERYEKRQETISRLRPWGTAFAAASALVIFVSTQGPAVVTTAHDVRPRYDVVPSQVAMRSTSAGIGDRVRLWAGPGQEARIYRAEKLLMRCTPSTPAGTPGCTRDDDGVMAELFLQLPGDYQLVIVRPADPATVEPAGSFDSDLAKIASGGGSYQSFDLPVR